ncbi:methyltransferase family protein [Natrarchaeobius oligotrophus]|uniref:Isoprenylcysteine carboxylmethyltransferase family protein n=1 Tax=Natrarchaeobius chitinivorans TaxID=1679083 RepID=A0A3N6MT87_NATCH|nr:isoprenylcysteine carboxylmethyltransferase family protein [Natrarchaeobius chitinivorans]RQG99581.1 isoprenylcysteine carboxylmethyltransferase family protein [Natrarchaeobius chitinivorans]
MGSISTYLKTIVFTILVPGIVAVAVPQLLARWRKHPELPLNEHLARGLGILSLVSGILLYVYTSFQFVSEGEGTPSPTDEPKHLVTGGIYAHSRNPMYIGVLLVILGQALLRRSVAILWWGAGMWIGFHNRAIGYEEPHLLEKHGEEYEKYREEVPRWFFLR